MAAIDFVKTLEFIRSKISGVPDVGIICGSGLAHLSKTLENPVSINYNLIPGFPRSTVEGHGNEMVFGKIGTKFVCCLRGRFHFYEGYEPSLVALPVRLLAALGCRFLVVTNAAGGLNPKFRVGDLMVITSHVALNGLAGLNPLIGPNDERFGPRFFPQHYETEATEVLLKSAEKVGFKSPIHKGTYIGCAGPSYETPAEISFMRAIRGDSVGMSTVFELMEAFHCGLRFVGLSLITNRCKSLDDDFAPPSHKEVLDAVDAVAGDVQNLVREFVKDIDLTNEPLTKAGKTFAVKSKL